MSKITYTIVLLLLIALTACKRNVSPLETQQKEEEHCFADSIILIKEEPVYDVVDIMPTFPGGKEALDNYVTSKIDYPGAGGEKRYKGWAVSSFIVEKDGSLTDIKVFNGVDTALVAKAIRAISQMPKWNPGRQNGLPVRVKYCLPLRCPKKTDKN